MAATGWLGEDEPGGAAPLPVTGMLLAQRQRGPGDTLAAALARSAAAEAREAREQAAAALDADDHAAALVVRGYRPGLLNELSQRLGDTVAELEAEREKVAKAARRAEIAAREHAAGRVDVWRMQAMMDGDGGDEGRVAMLERRAESLRAQIGEANEMIAPPRQGGQDPLEAAASRAHAAFREATRAAWEAAQSGTARREPRPFGSVSRGAAAGEGCPDCASLPGYLTAAQRAEVHAGATRAAAMASAGYSAYEPGHVITTGYRGEISRYDPDGTHGPGQMVTRDNPDAIVGVR